MFFFPDNTGAIDAVTLQGELVSEVGPHCSGGHRGTPVPRPGLAAES